MKALSIRQPWASLIIDGPKRIENRPRRTHFRGWCLVHASQSATLTDWLHWCDFAEARGLAQIDRHPRDLPRGGIIGAMRVVDCVAESDDPWFVGPFGHVLDRAIPLPFYPCKGQLGLFEVALPPEIAGRVPGE